jgi:hypothetical protein
MSTKTSIKRIALVAVSALGFGLLSSVSANAASANNDNLYQVPVTISNSNTTLAGRVGQQVSITVTGTWTTNAGSAATDLAGISVATAITSQPSTSGIYPTITGVGTAPTTNTGFGGYGLIQSGSTVANIAASSMTGTATTVATVNYNVDTRATNLTGGTNVSLATVTFTPTVAGTYTLVAWSENNSGSTFRL